MCPTAFNYDSRIHETSVPEVLEEWRNKLQTMVNRNVQDEKNLSQICQHLQRIQPQIAEHEFFDAFATFFYDKRGIFIHSLKMDSYLKVFIDRAQGERDHKCNIGNMLTPLEKRIATALNISSKDMNDVSIIVMSEHS